MSNGCRLLAKNKGQDRNLDSQITFLTQNTFSVSDIKNSAGYFNMDFNMYYSLFSKTDLSSISYLSKRYGSNTFVFISDSYAKKLVDYYGIKGENPLFSLISDESYCILNFKLDNGQSFSASINNVVSSTYRFGERTSELYGDFVLIYSNSIVYPLFDGFKFEIDFKVNQYGNKQILKDTLNLGYNHNNSHFRFFKFNYSTKSMYHDENTDVAYVSLLSENTTFFDIFYFCIILFFSFLVVILNLLRMNYFRNKNDLFLISTIFLFLYGVISIFVRMIHIASLFVVLSFTICLVFQVVFIVKREKNDRINKRVVTINI